MNPKLLLVGRVCRDAKIAKQMTNQEKMNTVEGFVRQYFWFGQPFVYNQDRLLDEDHPYPEYFAAGLYMKYEGDTYQRAIVVAHGNSMVDARTRMLSQGSKLVWE